MCAILIVAALITRSLVSIKTKPYMCIVAGNRGKVHLRPRESNHSRIHLECINYSEMDQRTSLCARDQTKMCVYLCERERERGKRIS